VIIQKRSTSLVATTATLAFAGAGAGAARADARVCRQGDPPITVSAHTTCAFAANAVNLVGNGRVHDGQTRSVYSPAMHRRYRLHFRRTGRRWTGTWRVTGPNGIWMRFSADI
jgi:hypothetical protein